jgi:hypothetical protein
MVLSQRWRPDQRRNEKAPRGSWKIEDNKLCSTSGRNRQLECYEVWASGQKISLRYFADMPAIEGVVASHGP